VTTLAGIDVSNFQGPHFNWAAYKGKVQFAGIKVTESTNFADIDARTNIAGAVSVGALPMAYHFLHAIPSGTEQANWFMAHCKSAGLERGQLMSLDVEQAGQDGQTPASLWARAVEAADVIKQHFGTWPVIYTDISLAQVAPAAIGAAPLWLANPSGTKLSAVGPWKVISFEQTGQRGVDTDVFYGSAAELKALALPVPKPTPPPVTPVPPVHSTTGLLVTVAGGIMTAKAVTSSDGKNWS